MRHISKKVLVKVDTKQKERYAFESGVVLFIERGFNFNRREDWPSLGDVISGDGLPEGAEVLIHHNATEKTYAVYGEELLTDDERRAGIMVLSIPEDMIFCHREGEGEWIPYKQFLLTARLFQPYKGVIHTIEIKPMPRCAYVVRGTCDIEGELHDLTGKVIYTKDNWDYEIVFMDKSNKEHRLIRTRDREILGVIADGLTKEVIAGNILIGTSPESAQKLKNDTRRKNKVA